MARQLAATIPLEELSEEELVEAVTERVEREKQESQTTVEMIEETKTETVGGMSFLTVFDLDNIQERKEKAMSGNREYVLYQLMNDYQTYETAMKQYEFIENKRPEVGDFLVFEAGDMTEQKDSSNYDFDFGEETVYRIIVEIVEESTVEFKSNGVEVPEFKYEVVEVSDELLELYSKHHRASRESSDNTVKPSDQVTFEVFEENPREKINVKGEGERITSQKRYSPPLLWAAY